MEIKLSNEKYKVNIIRKNNKHTYIRVKEDLSILVTTNNSVTNDEVLLILKQNTQFLQKNIKRKKISQEKNKYFWLFNRKYNIVYSTNIDEVIIENDAIITKTQKHLNEWLKNYAIKYCEERLVNIYNVIVEPIPLPILKIRDMTSRWGSCNINKNIVTLNLKLLKFQEEIIDYVIIHELMHFIEPNHSPNFWKLVGKYCPNYKKYIKELRG